MGSTAECYVIYPHEDDRTSLLQVDSGDELDFMWNGLTGNTQISMTHSKPDDNHRVVIELNHLPTGIKHATEITAGTDQLITFTGAIDPDLANLQLKIVHESEDPPRKIIKL